MSRSKAYRRVSCFWSACWQFSTWKRKLRLVQQREQIVLEKQILFPLFPIAAVRAYLQPVSFLNNLERVTLEHRISIVIGLKIMFFCLLWKGPIFEPKKISHNKRPYCFILSFTKHCLPVIILGIIFHPVTLTTRHRLLPATPAQEQDCRYELV